MRTGNKMVGSPSEAEQRAGFVVLVTSALGGVAGVVVPMWSVPWSTGYGGWPLILVLGILVVPIVGVICGAGIIGRLKAGVLVAFVDLAIAVAAFFLTFFLIGPGSIVGAWLLLAATIFRKDQPTRRLLMIGGLVAFGVTLLTSSGILLHFPSVALPLAIALNVCVVVYLAFLSLRQRREVSDELGSVLQSRS
ncbi:hypothetical protein [Promicromonospora sp. NPDC057488]|uniref:hypothetical protein n=1 Tax=Promicromonospora sp. NPDC057488 TaxID=3346147 RepID=UPI003672D7CE